MKNSTQITDAIRPVIQINPDFTHRYCNIFDDHRDLTDSLHIMASRALSVISLISSQFESNHSIVNNEIIYSALDSVTHELMDIQSYLQAFSNSKKEKEKEFDVGAYLKTLSDSNEQ